MTTAQNRCSTTRMSGWTVSALRVVTGEQRRDHGIKIVLDHTTEEYKRKFTTAYRWIVRSGQPFTSEDIISVVGMPPNHHNTVGALMSGLVRADLRSGAIEYIGHVKKTVAASHARKVSQYRGVRDE